MARAIAMAESHGSSTDVNPEWHKGCQGSIGLFQMACIHADSEKLKDPAFNTKVAYELWKEQGWSPWGAYQNGSYKDFLVASYPHLP